jgi:diguanylate cyclase (GGDEF)-like protein/PAS domain S-box-containing protein
MMPAIPIKLKHKELEAELKRLWHREAFFNATQEIAHYGYCEWDYENDRINFCTPAYAQIFGMSIDEVIKSQSSWQKVIEQIHPDDRNHYTESYRSNLGAGSHEVEYRIFRKDGEIRYIKEVGIVVYEADGKGIDSVGLLQDITEQKLLEQSLLDARESLEQQVAERTRELANTIKQLQIEIEEREKIAVKLDFLANHDALTGLPSLRLGMDRVEQALALSRRDRKICAVMFLDLDGFKQVNDEYGHEAGDHVLKVTAERIKAEIRETDTVARVGGDEFMIVLPCTPEISIIERIASDLNKQVAQDISIKKANVRIGVSIGIALYPENGSDVEKLIQAADKAMYQVKSKGKNDFGFVGFKTGRKIISDIGVELGKPD